ncbi:MAG: hypothetical protein FWC34_05425 [Bacteroidetes bacterium]|nr:hypothetical protein [Bacteroidota bacterium]MCL2303086.1 hypothetical protein [Lentimicrobiaceae bacterium]
MIFLQGIIFDIPFPSYGGAQCRALSEVEAPPSATFSTSGKGILVCSLIADKRNVSLLAYITTSYKSSEHD